MYLLRSIKNLIIKIQFYNSSYKLSNYVIWLYKVKLNILIVLSMENLILCSVHNAHDT